MTYAHLSQDERYQIQILHRAGFLPSQIGRQLARHPTTIARELRRNRRQQDYQAGHAQCLSLQRRHRASAQPRIAMVTWDAVEAALAEGLSPEQIAGRSGQVSRERIYQYIAADRGNGGSLWRHLRQRKRRRRRCGTPRQRQRFGGRRIHERPASVATRRRIGDWEGDTIVGRGRARVVTLVERRSGLLRIRKVENGEARPVLRAMLHALHPLRARVRTLTFDNGSEFAEHELLDLVLKSRSYFADPFASWQRGSNENTNGLLRQYLPKRCDLGAVTHAQLQQIEERLNNRPRKRLGFRTPNEVFYASFKHAALRS